VEGEHEFVFLEEPKAALEVDDVGVGVDDVLESVGLGVFVRFGRAQSFIEEFHLVGKTLVLHLFDF